MRIVNGKEFLNTPNPVLYIYLGDVPKYACDLLDDTSLMVKTYNYDDTDFFCSCSLIDFEYKDGGEEELEKLKKGESLDISTAYTSKDCIYDNIDEEETYYLIFEEKDIKKIMYILGKTKGKKQIYGGDGNEIT